VESTLAAEASVENRKTPVFLAHGSFDPVVTHAFGLAARDALIAQGYAVQWHEYPMQHQVCAEEIADIGAFLRGVLL
ncbi:carboxylesterase, partial [Acinetobacter baumannii]